MSAKLRVRLITPIWGESYIERWLGLCFAALRSEGNLSYLNEHCDFQLTLVTKSGDAERLAKDPKFNAVTAGIRVRFVSLDEFLPAEGQTSYGIPLTLAYAKGIIDPGPDAIGSYVILMNADFVLASGSMKSVVDRIERGFTIITANSIRIVDGTAREKLRGHVDSQTGILSISPRQMWHLANEHLHTSITSRIVNDTPPIDSVYYHQIYWRISKDCLAARSFLQMPLCFRIDRLMEKVLSPIDYGFLSEFCPDGRFSAIDDSDEYLMIEMQERHSESHWLRAAPKFATLDAYLTRLSSEIVPHASTWTTAEHRRAAAGTIYFHSTDLPPDLTARAAPFDAFVDTLLKKMPPPVSHIGHFQWLPAVRIYQEDMARAGAPGPIALLDDPRNRSPARADATAQTPGRLSIVRKRCYALALRYAGPIYRLVRRFLRPMLRLADMTRVYRAQLGKLVNGSLAHNSSTIDVAYIGDIHGYTPAPPAGARLIECGNPAASADPQRKFNVSIPPPDPSNGPSELVIYAGIGFLALWDRLEKDIGTFLTGRDKVVLVFIREGFLPLPFEGHTYILSLILNCLPRRKFRTSLDVYIASDSLSTADWKLFNPLHAAIMWAWLEINRMLGGAKRQRSPQGEFSALVIAIRPRNRP